MDDNEKPWDAPRVELEYATAEIRSRGYTLHWTPFVGTQTATTLEEWRAIRRATSLAELTAWRAQRKRPG